MKWPSSNPPTGKCGPATSCAKKGIFVSPGGVRSIWLRNDLETKKKRLKALEAKVAQDGIVLTEAQVAALEKAKQEKEAHGEIETEHLGSQDTFYVGTIKGVIAHLPANLHRHLHTRRLLQTLSAETRHHGG